MVGRKSRQKQQLSVREQILEAARELFAREGYERASMRRIATLVGYSPAALYEHFERKEDLLRSVCEESFANLIEQFETIGRNVSDPVDRLREVGRAYVDFGLSYPNHYKVTFTVPAASNPKAHKDVRVSAGERCFKFLQTVLAECAAYRRLREGDLNTTSQAIWAAMHGLTSLLIARPEFAGCNRGNLVEGLLDTVSEGLRAYRKAPSASSFRKVSHASTSAP